MRASGGMLLAQAFREKGVERVFTLSGGFCNPEPEGTDVALAMIERAYWEPGTRLGLRCGDGSQREAVVTRLPMEGP